jgi:glycosyltransferase involved in cell wall biosynthesis
MRVLICIDALGVGGKERQAVALIKGLAAAPEVDCRVVCFDSNDFYLRDLSASGISVDFVSRRVRWDVKVFHGLHRIVTTYQPDVIHTNGLVSSFYALPFAKLWRIPLVNGSIRNAFRNSGFRWMLERGLLELADYRVANSHAGLRSRNLSDQRPMNVVIYNGFDFARIARSGGRTGGGAVADRDVDAKTVGMVAEFNRFKDYFTFIEAARVISGKRRDALFVAVGDGETLNDCQKAAEGLDALSFLGKRKDIEELVETFSIGVLCSFVEGLSNSIMEYMALGKPVVATDGGGTRELVADGETGILVPQGDVGALATAIEHLLDHPDVAERMGRAGEAKVRREFSITRMIDETIALYRLAVTNSRGSGLHSHWRKRVIGL